ncbi:MAG: hypothetical protein WCS96_06295 [Victivallales bacterium]
MSVEVFDKSLIGRSTVLIGFTLISIIRKGDDYFIDSRLFDEDRPQPLNATMKADKQRFRKIIKWFPAVCRNLIEKTVIENRDALFIDPAVMNMEITGVAGKIVWSDEVQRCVLKVERILCDMAAAPSR